MYVYGSVALLLHFDKVLTLLKCKIYSCVLEPRSTDSLGHPLAPSKKAKSKNRTLNVLTLCQSAKVKQRYLCCKIISYILKVGILFLFKTKREKFLVLKPISSG